MSVPQLKSCPQCRNASHVAAKFCAFCGHAFQTQFAALPAAPSAKSEHSVWRAIGWSVLPGAGQVYNGQALKGAILWGSYFFWGFFIMLIKASDEPVSFFDGGALQGALYFVLFGVVDAAMIANRIRNGEKVGPLEVGSG